jgi:hypothetical protein
LDAVWDGFCAVVKTSNSQPIGDPSMIRRRTLLMAAPAIVPRSSLGQSMRKVKQGSAFTTTTTTNAMLLMPDLLSR